MAEERYTVIERIERDPYGKVVLYVGKELEEEDAFELMRKDSSEFAFNYDLTTLEVGEADVEILQRKVSRGQLSGFFPDYPIWNSVSLNVEDIVEKLFEK